MVTPEPWMRASGLLGDRMSSQFSTRHARLLIKKNKAAARSNPGQKCFHAHSPANANGTIIIGTVIAIVSRYLATIV